jgi:hypothetical protein
VAGAANIQLKFTEYLLELARRSNDELHYFIKMVKTQGGVGAAKTLLAQPLPAEGFSILKKLGRPDLTVEAAVLEQRWSSMFSATELATARARLEGGQ